MENIIGNINSQETENGNIVLKSGGIFCSSFYFQDFYDDKLIHKFIKSTESTIRHSKEYNDYIELLKTNYNILTFDNIQSHIGDGDASIEIHHYPLTLYEIVETLMTYHFLKNENFTSFTIAREVMAEHFNHNIGIVPLSSSNHKLAHDNGIFISTSQVFGQWKVFCEKYKTGVSEELREKIKHLESLSDAKMAADFRGLF